MAYLLIPDISSCFQVKKSWFSLRKFVIFIFSEAESAELIFKTLDGSPRTTSISYGTFDGSSIGSGSSIIHVWFSPDARAT